MNRWPLKKPLFWDQGASGADNDRPHFDFRRIWKRAVVLMLCVALLPLLALAWFDYRVTGQYSENEIVLRTDRLVSNTKRTVAFFLEERQAALQFVVREYGFADLNDDRRLAGILANLSGSIGGFTDLGLFNAAGRQIRYIGPYALKDRDYRDEPWFREVVAAGSHVSDVYLGFREEPHMVIAVKREKEDGSFFVLRATLNTVWFNEQLAHIRESSFGDSFLVNLEGVIQTPTLNHGEVLDRFPLAIPPYAEDTRVVTVQDRQGRELVMGYAYIPGSPFILLAIGEKAELLRPWISTRVMVVLFLAGAVLLIVLVTLGVATNLVGDIYRADRERATALREAARANKLASLGRLAAGVAHEINNPLAIINEKAGLLADLLTRAGKEPPPKEKLLSQLESIHRAVARCSGITRRLLGFARPGEIKLEQVELAEVVREVLEFHGKEAAHRNIIVGVEIDSELPALSSDRNKLQQVFLNLVGNAFAAMEDGGHLYITGSRPDPEHLLITVTDDGCGIAEADLKKVFEPFFSTKSKEEGTGLGLFVTYGLVRELQGRIRVESMAGAGTRFFITLPLRSKENAETGEEHHADFTG
ncbi:sensor histidine kinase [Desulfurivibrio dismutans]|uniref:sensor histidine kinase n=1 Tax=Desulfurivibrio dismutans TaxID=1398908 RepID=UPI0023DB2BA0|nr:PAS domain-containing sensor histidine kinase [Desulfurivibrio alkaliphilus]MDF1614307.1 ATP-binding protein [Desulfurivibrio alkaliphilus]